MMWFILIAGFNRKSCPSVNRRYWVRMFHEKALDLHQVLFYFRSMPVERSAITLFHQTRQIMAIIKTIAIVGATGNMGSAIARSLSKKGNYRLLLTSNNEDKLVDLKLLLEKSKTDTEAFAISCARKHPGRRI